MILNLQLDFEFDPFPGMRQALRALEVGTPEVPSRFLEIKNLRNLHPNFKFTIGLGWWLLFLSRFENICWRRWTLCTSARSAWTSSGEFCFWLFCFFLVNVERPRFERNEIERAEFLRRSLANLIAHKRSYCQEKFEVRYFFTSHLILCSHLVASSLPLLSKITLCTLNTTNQGVAHVFDTMAGVEAAQLQTVVVQAEEVRCCCCCWWWWCCRGWRGPLHHNHLHLLS